MRRCIFSFAWLTSILALANSASAQTSFEMAEMQGAMTYEGGVSPAGYYGHAMQLPTGPNSNWGYSGTCCSNIWAGYCEEHQGCRHGCHRNAGCGKTSLWQRLMCARPKLFGNSNCCGRSHCRGCGRRGCSSGAGNCGAGNCGSGNCSVGHYGPLNGENSGAADAEEIMPMPPETNLPEKLPYDAASPGDDHQTSVRKGWNMPRITSSHVKSRR
jgi:hypothetical protein